MGSKSGQPPRFGIAPTEYEDPIMASSAITEANSNYPAIGSLAALGDGHSLALIGPDGGLEWFCPRRFDSSPLIWPLLDRVRGGRMRLAASGDAKLEMRYLDGTAVLDQRWTSDKGEARVTLGMVWPAQESRQILLWCVEGISGELNFEMMVEPSRGFGEAPVAWSMNETGQLQADEPPLRLDAECRFEDTDAGWRGWRSVKAGERFTVALQVGLDSWLPAPLPSAQSWSRLEGTIDAWRAWSGRLRCPERHRDLIVRSAITLKLLIHQPTGAVVAAGTTSLPEALGGTRNWDYRYTWFRDAGMTLAALFSLGCHDEAHRWAQWLQDTVERHGMPLQILYTVDGLPAPSEREIENADGYCGSAPVRDGNAADTQRQLDIYGELLECVYVCDSMEASILQAHWPHMLAAANFIAGNWREPDQGIWEVRSEPRQFVHSKVMAWAGLQRALWLQRRHDLKADVATWRREADAIREQVLREGLSADGRHFVRAYGDEGLDAALLLLARSGFVAGDEALFRATLDAVRDALAIEGQPYLVRRYLSNDFDGLNGSEGAFLICSFWLVEAMIEAGAQADAEAMFEQLRNLQGKFGLFAEEADPASGAQRGNLPQAFSHVGLINAAISLADRSGRAARP
ncbi:glycoside hydrolase family 15 protein [Pseudomonas sp. PS1]|uniref:Glycoside hydrolase family 15 protein n=1 Tax=Stutzerimonas marianensis TaxID=2929513 RepID=A0A9X1W615_9GAMM|nr:glycoside hydrolase family 15 protein [Pseudomonas marianensis]